MPSISIVKPKDNAKVSHCFSLGISVDLEDNQYYEIVIDDDGYSGPYYEHNGEIDMEFKDCGVHKICAELHNEDCDVISSDCIHVEVVDYACSSCGYSPCCCGSQYCHYSYYFHYPGEKNIAVVQDYTWSCCEISKNASVVIVYNVCPGFCLYLPALQRKRKSTCISIVRGREIKIVNNSSCVINVCTSCSDTIAPNKTSVVVEPGDCNTFFEHHQWHFC